MAEEREYMKNEAKNKARNKIVIVIGATGGIGRVLAESFLKQGFFVVLCSRTENKLIALQQELGSEHTLVVAADATKADDVANLFEKTKEKFGHVDAVVITTGTWERVSIDTPVDDAMQFARAHIESFYMSAFTVGFIAQQFFRTQGGGLIVNISSHAAVRPKLSGNLTYGPAKSAARHLMLALRHELAGSDVRLVDLQPATVNTPKNAGALDSEKKQKEAVQPEVIAKWIVDHFDDPDIAAEHLFDSDVIL